MKKFADHLIDFCKTLPEIFVLPQRQVAKKFDTTHCYVARTIKKLVADGKLEIVEQGSWENLKMTTYRLPTRAEDIDKLLFG